MDFLALILFLALYYLRPQDWSPNFNALHPIQLLSVLALWAMIQTGKLKPRDLLRTPLDWLVAAYFGWTLIAGWQFSRSLGEIQSVLLFYFVAVRSLDTLPRQKTFLTYWCFFMVAIAALAIASLHGFDPFDSNDLTQGPMKGRLVLNLTIFDNPNSLAHSIIPAVPLIYYLFVWRRTAAKVGIVLMAIPLYCILLTQSKGAFLSGFATILATLTFGRSKVWQVIILILAVGFGYGALYTLPRMNELNSSKTDPAIQGRVAAFTYGLHLMKTNWLGIGLGNFKDDFLHNGPLEKQKVVRILPSDRHVELRDRVPVWTHYSKATHSAYNQNGAELGYFGFFLFIGILYCCIRTLWLMKCANSDEERIRRALFAMVVAYAASSWMVDFCYRPTFFLFIAAISGLQRYMLDKEEKVSIAGEGPPAAPVLPWLRRPPLRIPGIVLPGLPIPVVAGSMASAPILASSPLQAMAFGHPLVEGPALSEGPAEASRPARFPWQRRPEPRTPSRKVFNWNRLGLLDYLIMLVLTRFAIYYWQHLINTM